MLPEPTEPPNKDLSILKKSPTELGSSVLSTHSTEATPPTTIKSITTFPFLKLILYSPSVIPLLFVGDTLNPV